MLRNRRGVGTCVRACTGFFRLLEDRMGAVRITSLNPKFNGSHFGLPPSSIHRMTGWVAISRMLWRKRTVPINCNTVLSVTVTSWLFRPKGPHQCSAGSVAGWAQKSMPNLDALHLWDECKSTMPSQSAQVTMSAFELYSKADSNGIHRGRVLTKMCKHTRSLNDCRQLLADCFGYCFSWPFFLFEFTHCIFSSLSLSIVLPFFLIEYPLSKCNRFSVKFSGKHKFGWGGGTVLALRHPVVEPRNMRATNAKAVFTVFSWSSLSIVLPFFLIEFIHCITVFLLVEDLVVLTSLLVDEKPTLLTMHKDTNAENKYRGDAHQTKENNRETYNLTNNIWRRPQHIQFRRDMHQTIAKRWRDLRRHSFSAVPDGGRVLGEVHVGRSLHKG